MENLNWVPVTNYEGYYEVNETGEIRSLHKRNYSQILHQRIDRAGYYTVRLNKKGKTYTHWVHRLIGATFIPNSAGKQYINHKNGNKLNNSLENLEWVSHSENIFHAYDKGLLKRAKNSSLRVVNFCTGLEYESVKLAADSLGIAYSTCKNYLNGNRPNPTCLRYAA
jgi:hypothetical protein